jgi:hypothetical protein
MRIQYKKLAATGNWAASRVLILTFRGNNYKWIFRKGKLSYYKPGRMESFMEKLHSHIIEARAVDMKNLETLLLLSETEMLEFDRNIEERRERLA